MSIESGPKFTPEENNDSTDGQESAEPTKKDWSNVEKILEEKQEKDLAAMPSEDRKKAIQEDERVKKQTEEIHEWAQGKQNKQESLETDNNVTRQTGNEVKSKQLAPQTSRPDLARDKLAQEDKKKNLQTIREQEYQKIRAEMERFRKEHNIQKTAEELEEEDRELRNKFGLE